MKKLFFIFFIFLNFSFAWSLFSNKTPTEYAKSYCQKLQAKLPMKLDEITTYTNCYNKKNVIYNIAYIDTSDKSFKKLFHKQSFLNDLKSIKEKEIYTKICPKSNWIMESILINKHNVEFVNIFKEKETNQTLLTVIINKNICHEFLKYQKQKK